MIHDIPKSINLVHTTWNDHKYLNLNDFYGILSEEILLRKWMS